MKKPISTSDEHLPLGARLKLENAREGWFDGAASALFGTVAADLGPKDGSNRWYLVKLDSPLAIQESGHDTPSGLRLVRYSRLLVSSRWKDWEINNDRPISVFVNLVPEDRDAVEYLESVNQPNIWADCAIYEGSG